MLTSLTLMDEELRALHARGVELHTILHDLPEHDQSVLKCHVMPRIRNVPHSTTAAIHCLTRIGNNAYSSPSIVERFLLARIQHWIAKVVRENKIKILHSHWARPMGSAGAAAKRRTGVPLVMTLRGADILNEPSIGYGNTLNPAYVKRLRHAFRHADRIIGVSSQIADRAIELGAHPDRTVVIHKGVDTERFCPKEPRVAKSELGLEERPTILFVGAFGPWKGISDLLAAFLAIKKRVPDAQLVMCGKGKMLDDIRGFIREHEFENDVILPGHVNRELVPSYFQACDVFVLPSLTEGSGNVLLEAAACGRPTVGTRVGGIPDYIADGKTGFLCEKSNPKDLTEKLLTILEDEKLSQHLGSAGLAQVQSGFRYDQMIQKIIDVYRDVL